MKNIKLPIVLFLLFGFQTVNAQWLNGTGIDGAYISSITVCGDELVAGTITHYPNFKGKGIFHSTDNGNSWSQLSGSLAQVSEPTSLLCVGDTILAAANDIFRSTDKGVTWTTTGAGKKGFTELKAIGPILFAATGADVYRSTDRGSTWDKITATPLGGAVRIAVSGTILFAGESTYGNGLFYSTDLGNTWNHSKSSGMSSPRIYALGVKDTNIFATNSGIFYSNDTGNSWTLQRASNYAAYAFTDHIYFGGGIGLDYTTDAGYTWNADEFWFPNDTNAVTALFINKDYLFAAMQGHGIWRRTISEFSEISETLKPMLSIQNFPNPFTSITTIDFVLPKQSEVSLSLIDPLGNTIILQTSTILEAGRHSINWNGNTHPDGVYYCRITADGMSETRKMIIMR